MDIRDFDKIDVPCVLVTGDASDLNLPNLSSVATNDVEAARCAIQTLVSLGHRKFAIIGGDRSQSDTSRLRFEGCRQAFAEFGISFEESRDYRGVRFSCEDGYQATKALLAGGSEFTAIFAMADVMAMGAIRALWEAGLRVPEDVSVMGIDGLPMGTYLIPQLSTIRQSVRLMAIRSVEILLNAMETGCPACHETIPFEVEKRESIRNI